MRRVPLPRWPMRSRFAGWAAVCAVPVVVLGLVLTLDFGHSPRWSDAAALVHLAGAPAPVPAVDDGMRQAPTPVAETTTGTVASLRASAVAERRTNMQLTRAFERDLIIGLGGLYLTLFLVGAWATRRLRREAARTAAAGMHDPLTGLPNRTSFTARVAEALAVAERTGEPAAVALVDLDRFKHINDTLGHRNGDAVISELAERLAATLDRLAPGAFLARLGGDEFGVVLPDGRDAVSVLRTIRSALDREVPVAGIALTVPGSVGYVLAPDDGEDTDTLLQRADVAMYGAKEARRGLARYEPSLDRYDAASLGLVAELRHAIDADQLVLHYQPQVHLGSDRVVALEALVRWRHPVHGLLYPDRFLPLAEQTDDIDRLTAWVLRRALRDVCALGPECGRPRVAVNVSARSLGSGQLADEVLDALRELDVAPDRLIVEVTETAIFVDPARAAGELHRLANAGVRVSLDDFGCGQTSIGHFSALPLHELKIDRSFVGDMDADPIHAAIVRSIVELGRNLGLQVVAEGVENDEVRELLREAGTDVLQGYLLCRPLPLAETTDWLAARPGDGSGRDGEDDARPVALTGREHAQAGS